MTSGGSDKHNRWQHQGENTTQSATDQNEEPANLEQMLNTLRDGVGDRETVSIKTMLDAAGSRSFAPALLVEAWEKAFSSDDPAEGGCPNIKAALE